jgi:hypothetical protein
MIKIKAIWQQLRKWFDASYTYRIDEKEWRTTSLGKLSKVIGKLKKYK